MSKDRFIKVYGRLSENVRNEVIVAIKRDNIDKPYTWDSAYVEVSNDTPLGKEILKKLEKMELI